LAILGNTGSGKSCTVAGLIRWSLTAALRNLSDGRKGKAANARFIILDPNGEYGSAFKDQDDLGRRCRRFQVPPPDKDVLPLHVPAWMWNGYEWAAFSGAAAQVQRPALMQALRELRAGTAIKEPVTAKIARVLTAYRSTIALRIANPNSGYRGGNWRVLRGCGDELLNLAEDCRAFDEQLDAGPVRETLLTLATLSQNTATADGKQYFTQNSYGFNDFTAAEMEAVRAQIDAVISTLPDDEVPLLPSADSPLRFDIADLPGQLEDSRSGDDRTVQYLSTLALRIREMLGDGRLTSIIKPPTASELTFESWLEFYIGANDAANGEVAILDLSLVPADVLHIVVAAIARITFEAMQRYRRLINEVIPTVLVLEEAHVFVSKGREHDDGPPSVASICRQTFEKIAREGRKFGLGLVLSSQRPSELSETVLAQCNTFLLHRLVNDRDQDFVRRLVPDSLGELFQELPSLPSRQAILLGWAAHLPVLVEIGELPEHQRPRSSDPDFWQVWTGEKERPINWDALAKDWREASGLVEEVHDVAAAPELQPGD
jgi:hypothetical protein